MTLEVTLGVTFRKQHLQSLLPRLPSPSPHTTVVSERTASLQSVPLTKEVIFVCPLWAYSLPPYWSLSTRLPTFIGRLIKQSYATGPSRPHHVYGDSQPNFPIICRFCIILENRHSVRPPFFQWLVESTACSVN